MMKPTIILLHGWGGSIKSLEALDATLQKEGYATLRLEMPGHGNTPAMNAPWAMDNYSQWLQSYIDELTENYILVGHSFGGRIILHSAINQKVNPQKIVLIDSSGVKPKNSLKKTAWKLIATLTKPLQFMPFYSSIRLFIYTHIIGEKDYVKTHGALKETFKIVNEAYYNHEVKKITIKTLILWGKEDKTTPLWMGEYLKQQLPNSKLTILPGRHGLPLQSPELVAKEIITFIQT